MNLEQIKNDYAVGIGYDDWKSMLTEIFQFSVDEIIEHENEVMILAQKECLKRAVNNKVLYPYKGIPLINSEDVTNENNIIK